MRVDTIPTEKGNSLIASYLGFKLSGQFFTYPSDKEVSGLIGDLRYDHDWAYLMPVVLLLEDKGVDIRIYYRNCHIGWSDDSDSYEVKSGIQCETKIAAVWTAICYFLTWVKDEEIDLDNPTYFD